MNRTRKPSFAVNSKSHPILLLIFLLIAGMVVIFYAKLFGNESPRVFADSTTDLLFGMTDDGTGIVVLGFRSGSTCDALDIPGSYNGKPVVAIADNAFAGESGIITAFLPESVKTVGKNAFRNCDGLIYVDLPAVTELKESAFEGCSELEQIILPFGLSVIPKSAFKNCTSLSEVVFPEGLAFIEERAFENCISLTGAVFSSGLETVGRYAFKNCSGLHSIFFSDLQSIDTAAFYQCASLSSVTLPMGFLYLGDAAFSGCTALSSVSLPVNISYFGEWAFCGCKSLSSVTLPSGIRQIGDYCFVGCTALSNVLWPSDLPTIPCGTFEGCTSLTNISIPDNVTKISDYAFYNCRSLVSASLPISLKTVGARAFSGCLSFETAEYDGTMQNASEIYIGRENEPLRKALPKESTIEQNYDVNNDGTVDIRDVTLYLDGLAEGFPLPDFDGDDTPTISDVSRLLNYLSEYK